MGLKELKDLFSTTEKQIGQILFDNTEEKRILSQIQSTKEKTTKAVIYKLKEIRAKVQGITFYSQSKNLISKNKKLQKSLKKSNLRIKKIPKL